MLLESRKHFDPIVLKKKTDFWGFGRKKNQLTNSRVIKSEQTSFSAETAKESSALQVIQRLSKHRIKNLMQQCVYC